MTPYQQQLDAMINALINESASPDIVTANRFKKSRINAISRALSMVNLFVPAAGNFPEFSSNSTYSVFTKPLNRDVIVLGCALQNADTLQENRIFGEFRVRLPEPLSHLSQSYLFPAIGFAPASYSIFFPCPWILRAGEQMAVDFGLNAPQSNIELDTTRQEIVFFCVSVKDCLSTEDLSVLEAARRVIRDADYQRRVYLNSATPGSRATTPLSGSQFFSNQGNMVIYTPNSTANVLTTSETRMADVPLLVIGVGISGCGSQIRTMDTGTGHSFTQGEFIYTRNLFNSEELLTPFVNASYYSYFRLPVAHLLKPGSTLFSEHINGGGDAEPLESNPAFLMWECLTP